MNKNEILRQLPKMDRILQEPEAEELCRLYGKKQDPWYTPARAGQSEKGASGRESNRSCC